jgi:hypothetical protein
MTETIESRIKKLEGKAGPQSDEDIVFTIYLVKPKGKKILRREWPEGKYAPIDPASLGIEPHTPIERPQAVIKEPPVRIAVPATKDALNADIEENPEKRIERIRSAIYRDFNHD